MNAYEIGTEARIGIGTYLDFYVQQRPHQPLGYRTPDQAYAEAGSRQGQGGVCRARQQPRVWLKSYQAFRRQTLLSWPHRCLNYGVHRTLDWLLFGLHAKLVMEGRSSDCKLAPAARKIGF